MIGFVAKIYRTIVPVFIRAFFRDLLIQRGFHPDTEIEFYGAYKLLLTELKIKKIKYPLRSKITWSHGWYADFLMLDSKHPYLGCFNIKCIEKGVLILVARKSQEDFIKALGYSNVKAIGAPITYLPKVTVQRTLGSLLVMPAHSLDYIDLVTFENEYVAYLNSIRHEYSKVTVCVHPSCLKNGNWINSFKEFDYDIITGVEISDENCFCKLQKLFSSYEYVTSNKYGSHMIYASYFGAKVSIIGKASEFKMEQMMESDTWKNNDKDPLIEAFSKNTTRNYMKHYPQFYVNQPKEATINVELAKYELGESNKIDKESFDSLIIKYLN